MRVDNGKDKGRPDRSLHRIKQARQTAGISLRSMARRMRTTATKLKEQENRPDLSLAELYRWQRELKVPVTELLAEPEAHLSEPIRQRACLLRVAKTAHSLLKKTDSPASERLARTLIDQLEELMPELKEVGAWPEYGQRRSTEDMGRAAFQVVPTENLAGEPLDDGPF